MPNAGFLNRRSLLLSFTNCGKTANAQALVSLGNADLAFSSMRADCFDAIPVAADGSTALTFGRVSSSNVVASQNLTIGVTIPSTPANGSYTLNIDSVKPSATDTSAFASVFAKFMPAGAAAKLGYKFDGSGTTSEASDVGSNVLLFPNNATRPAAPISTIGTTSVKPAGKCVQFAAASSQYAKTTSAVDLTNIGALTLHWRVTIPASFSYDPLTLLGWENQNAWIGIRSTGVFQFQAPNGNAFVQTNTLTAGQTYEIEFVANPCGNWLYINGVLYKHDTTPLNWPTNSKIYLNADARGSSISIPLPNTGSYYNLTVDSFWLAGESYAPEDALAHYCLLNKPIAQTQKRKWVKIAQGGSYSGPQLLLAPVSGFGSTTGGAGSGVGLQEPCPLFAADYGFPNGWPTVAGNPDVIMSLTDTSAETTGYATCKGDPKVGGNWTIHSVAVIGGGVGGESGTAAMGDLTYDPVAAKFILSYSTSYSAGGAIKAILSSDFATWSAPVTLIAANSVTGYHAIANHRVLPATDGTKVMIVEATGTSNFGLWTLLLFTSPNFTNGGTWTFSQALTSLNTANAMHVNSPGALQYGSTTQLVYNLGGQDFITTAATDRQSFTSYTPYGAAVLEEDQAIEAPTGVGDPRLAIYGTSTLLIYDGGANGGTSIICMAVCDAMASSTFTDGSFDISPSILTVRSGGIGLGL